MVQHLLLTVVAPLLLVLSQPAVLLRRALPLHWRRSPPAPRAPPASPRRPGPPARPLVAWILFCGSFVLWHLPGPCTNSCCGTIPCGGSSRSASSAPGSRSGARSPRPRMCAASGHGLALLMVVTAAVISGLPGALMTFAPRLLYPVSADTAALCGLTPFEDQQLAGLLMWIPMDAAFFAVAAWLFVAWLREAERRASLAGRRAEQAMLGSCCSCCCSQAATRRSERGRGPEMPWPAGSRVTRGAAPLLVRQYRLRRLSRRAGNFRGARAGRSAAHPDGTAHLYRRDCSKLASQHDGLAAGSAALRSWQCHAEYGHRPGRCPRSNRLSLYPAMSCDRP